MRDYWLEQDDAALLAECDVDTYRASGPGGQKRNKTSSAVRLRHRRSGLMVIAEESRSQHENKARAVRRLRMALALELRDASDAARDRAIVVLAEHSSSTGRLELSHRNPAYLRAVASALDLLAHRQGELREAAALAGMSTAQLSRFICDDVKVMDAANRIRRQAGLKPLVAP